MRLSRVKNRTDRQRTLHRLKGKLNSLIPLKDEHCYKKGVVTIEFKGLGSTSKCNT